MRTHLVNTIVKRAREAIDNGESVTLDVTIHGDTYTFAGSHFSDDGLRVDSQEEALIWHQGAIKCGAILAVCYGVTEMPEGDDD